MIRKKLSQLSPGDKAIVSSLHGDGNVKHRLIDMGIVKGTKISVIKYAPLGDPIEIRVKNFDLALRISEAEMIEVELG